MPPNIRIIASASADNLVEDSAHSLSNYEEVLVLVQRGMDLIHHSRMIVQELKLHYPQSIAMLKALDINEWIEIDGPDDESDTESFVSANEDFSFMACVIPNWAPTVHEKETQTLNAESEKAVLEKESQTPPEFTTSIIPNGLVSDSSGETNCTNSPSLLSSCENSIEPTSQYIQDEKQGLPSLRNQPFQLPNRVLHRASTSLTFLTQQLEKQQSFPFSTIKNVVNRLSQKLHITSGRKKQQESFQASQETLKTCASTSDWSSPRPFMKKAIALLSSSLQLGRDQSSSQIHPTTVAPSRLDEKNPKLEVHNESASESGRKFSIEFISISNAKSIGVKVASKAVQSGQHLVSRFVPAMFAKPISRWINLPYATTSHTPSPLHQGSSLPLNEEPQPPVLTCAEASGESKVDSSPPSMTNTQIHAKQDPKEKEDMQANVAKPDTQFRHFIVSRFVPATFVKPISRWIPLPTASATLSPSHLQQGSSLTLKEETQPPVLSYAASSSISESDSQIKAIAETQIHPKHDSTENEKVQASVAKTDAQSCHLFPQDDELVRRYFERRAYLNEKVGLVRRSYRRMKHIAICGYHIQELLQEYGIIETVCTMAFD